MGLEVLQKFASGLGTVGTAIGGIQNLRTLFGGRNAESDIPTLSGAGQAAEAARVYANASADPDSPHFKNLELIMRETLRREATQRTLKDMLMRRRAGVRSGFSGAVYREREDEHRAGNLAMMRMLAGEQARTQARDFLSQASQNAAGAAGAFSPTFAPYQTAADSSQGMKASGWEALGPLIKELGDLFGNNQPSGGTLPPPPPQIPPRERTQAPRNVSIRYPQNSGYPRVS